MARNPEKLRKRRWDRHPDYHPEPDTDRYADADRYTDGHTDCDAAVGWGFVHKRF